MVLQIKLWKHIDNRTNLMYSGKMGRMLQGVAADCNSAEATHAWFDSMPAHHTH